MFDIGVHHDLDIKQGVLEAQPPKLTQVQS